MRDQIRAAADVALSLRPVVETARRATRRRLRVLAYHGVDNPIAFDRQMVYISEHYNPVSAHEVEAAINDTHHLPDYAVWVTFDDGLPSVMRNALPILKARRISATMFVCPGVINTSEPLWWQLVETCVRDGVLPKSTGGLELPRLIENFKSLQTDDLMVKIAQLRVEYRRQLGREPEQPQLTTADLRRLLDTGHTIGNHTWTHLLLDQCNESGQRGQIVSAHEWLERELGMKPTLFAYPNGNRTSAAERYLREFGYSFAVLFDHRLGMTRAAPLLVSRLRADDSNSSERFAAILAGSHPLLSAVRRSRVRTCRR